MRQGSRVDDTVMWKDLLRKYDRPTPRYTSYPPANRFVAQASSDAYARALAGHAAEGIDLYVHIPFCERRCTYCGCFVVPARRRTIAAEYLTYLERELELARRASCAEQCARGVHLGGGTPTYLTPFELGRLFDALEDAFPLEAGAEVSVEIDPRVTTAAHVAVLRARGLSRASLGVQDASAEVQDAIGRHQTWEQTTLAFELCRTAGLESINIDLVYGLPHQTRSRFEATLAKVLELRPDRLAVFAYAHVPSVRPNQRALDAVALPGSEERLDLLLLAHGVLTGAGYRHIGLDHYALPEDGLATAQREGTLARGFMGYTDRGDGHVLGFGASAISDTAGGYFQNEKKLASYFRRLERRELPVERGWVPSADDRIRRWVIHEVFCRLRVDFGEFEARYGLGFREHFGNEWRRLIELEEDGLVEMDAGALRVTPPGRVLLRTIGSVFDAYLEAGAGRAAAHSRTV